MVKGTMRANANSISDADYDAFELDEGKITGDVLWDLNHRFSVGQIVDNHTEAHPNGPPLLGERLSNRLATVKARIVKQTGRDRRHVNDELENALQSVGVEKNGKTHEVQIPYPPRGAAPLTLFTFVPRPRNTPTGNGTGLTGGGGGVTTSGGDDAVGNPAANNSKDEDEDESPSGGVVVTNGEEEEVAGGDDDAGAPSTATAEPKGNKKKRPVSEGGESDKEEEAPSAKRQKSAPSKKPSEGDNTGRAVGADGVSAEAAAGVVGAEVEEARVADEDDDRQVEDRGDGEAAGSVDAPRKMPKYGGAIVDDPNDPSSIRVASEWNPTLRGPSIVHGPKEDVDLAPPHPTLSRAQYAGMGLEGTAGLTIAEQKKLRNGGLTFFSDKGKAAQAGQEVSKTNGDIQEEADAVDSEDEWAGLRHSG